MGIPQGRGLQSPHPKDENPSRQDCPSLGMPAWKGGDHTPPKVTCAHSQKA